MLGIVGVISPIGGSTPGEEHPFSVMLESDFPVVLGFSLALVLLTLFYSRGGGRFKGFLLAGSYVAYTVWLCVGAIGPQ